MSPDDFKFERSLSRAEKAEIGRNLTLDEFRSSGGRVLGEEVTFEVRVPGQSKFRIRADNLGVRDGKLTVLEAKFGPSARLTRNQRKAFGAIRRGEATLIPRGARAKAAGLTPGEALQQNPDLFIRFFTKGDLFTR